MLWELELLSGELEEEPLLLVPLLFGLVELESVELLPLPKPLVPGEVAPPVAELGLMPKCE